MAGTVVQNLRNRCHILPCLSKRQNGHGATPVTMQMQRSSEVMQMNTIRQQKTTSPTSREKDALLRHGELLPKITYCCSFRPSGNLFAKKLATVNGKDHRKMAIKVPYSAAC